MKKIVHYLRMAPAIIFAVTINLAGYIIYLLARLLCSLGLLLMLSPWAAKRELQGLGKNWWRI